MRYYDKHHKRLIYIAETASPEYWDHHWESKNLRAEITKKHFDQLVIPTTKKYLAPGSRVLEGGCGTGVHVFGLRQNGFESIGVDNAPETVRLAKEAVPEMDIRLGDVLTLDFEDNYFDGYWSIGVIEHFWDGYEPVLSEMKRLLKPGGYLFLTFPYMSPLRKWKARRGQYPMHEHMRSLDSPFGLARDDAPHHFYQFALNHHDIIKTFEARGFTLVQTKPFDGFKGLTDESPAALRLLSPIARGRSLVAKILKITLSVLMQKITGHSILVVLQKN